VPPGNGIAGAQFMDRVNDPGKEPVVCPRKRYPKAVSFPLTSIPTVPSVTSIAVTFTMGWIGSGGNLKAEPSILPCPTAVATKLTSSTKAATNRTYLLVFIMYLLFPVVRARRVTQSYLFLLPGDRMITDETQQTCVSALRKLPCLHRDSIK